MLKFSQLEKGSLIRDGKEYDYIVEVSDDFPKKKQGNVRLRIIDERPAIRKVRTRYDPEIEMYGDKDASMDVLLGYNPKDLKGAFWFFIFFAFSPVYAIGFFILLSKIPAIQTMPKAIGFIGLPILGVICIFLAWKHIKMCMGLLAQHLKAKELAKKLEKEGVKQ